VRVNETAKDRHRWARSLGGGWSAILVGIGIWRGYWAVTSLRDGGQAAGTPPWWWVLVGGLLFAAACLVLGIYGLVLAIRERRATR
jgi:uncharacterized membrane protein